MLTVMRTGGKSRMRRLSVTLALAMMGAGCGGDDASCDSASGTCGGTDAGGSASSLLGAGASSYTEAHEATNGTASMAESTSYVLESEQGIAIHGSWEATAPTDDVYRFNAGALGTASKPGFPGVDVQLVVDGKVVRVNTPLLLSLDTVVEKGYSSLSGGSYFTNAALIKGEDYVLKLAPQAPGKSYTLEIRGHVASP